MQREPGHHSKPPVRVSERTVEQDVYREIREDLVATDSGPQYIWRERVRSRYNETVKDEAR